MSVRSIFYQPSANNPEADPWVRARAETPFSIEGLTPGEYRLDDGETVWLETIVAAVAPALSGGSITQSGADLIITAPTATGTPTPTVTLVIVTRGDDDITGSLVGLTIPDFETGDYVVAFTASNGVSPDAMSDLSGSFTEAGSTFMSIVGSGAPGSNTFNITDAQTWYGQIGGTNGIVNDANPKSLTELNVQRRWQAGILSDGVLILAQQTRLQPSAWRTRINGAYGEILVLNPGGAITTGSAVVYRDATHSDAVANNDMVNVALDISAEGAAGFAVNPHVGFSLESVSQSDGWCSFFRIAPINFSISTIRYVGYTGLGTQVTTPVGAASPIACTMDRFQILVSTPGSVTKLYSSNVNGAAGNLVCVMDSAALIEDATHIDAIAEGDLIQGQLTGGGTTPAYIGGGVRMRSATANQSAVISHGTSPIGGNGIAPANFWAGFNHLRRNNSDGESRNAIVRACLTRRVAVNVAANVETEPLTVSTRRSAVNLNGVVTIPAGQVGVFTDVTHTDAFLPDENVNMTSPITQAAGTTFGAISYRYEVTA